MKNVLRISQNLNMTKSGILDDSMKSTNYFNHNVYKILFQFLGILQDSLILFYNLQLEKSQFDFFVESINKLTLLNLKLIYQDPIDINLTVQNLTSQPTLTQIKVIDKSISLVTQELRRLFWWLSQVAGSEHAGLSIYLAKWLTNLVGYDVSISSEKGKNSIYKGGCFFKTPTQEEIKKFQKDKILALTSTSPRCLTNKQQVLIVDDNIVNRKILGTQLTKAGYVCQFACNGQEALVAYDRQVFDVILMDIEMPIMDGITATCEIRKREQAKQLSLTPIIATTANVLERNRVEALRSGVNAYIIKPCKKEELFQKITELTQSEKPMIVKGNCKIAFDSPLNSMAQIRSVLNTITPDKKWGINVAKRMLWLELQDEEEANQIIEHFKRNNYLAIECKYKVNAARSVPVIVLNEFNYEKLKTISSLSFINCSDDMILRRSCNDEYFLIDVL